MNIRRQLILDKHLNGVDYNNGHELNEAVIAAMEEYAQEQLKIFNIPVVTNRICPKANQCANTPGGCICPKNVICPL